MISSLDRKLARDIWKIKGQALAIMAVIACGIATFVMSLSTLSSLELTRATYYNRYRFAHVFTHLKRAPETLKARIQDLPGVSQVQTRIVMDVTLDVDGLAEPAVGRLISIPDRKTTSLNDIYLRSGRYIDPTRAGEVLVGESFAIAHKLQLGDSITAVINGSKQDLTVVGVALSPEYVLQFKPGELLPDPERFGVFWMGETQLASAFDMDGAFNDVTLSVMRGANIDEVVRLLDDLTEPYGGTGAYDREEQNSHRYLSDEIQQLKGMARVAPTIFLSVAAFLLNVVLSRVIKTQREQIAALKAFGYSKWEVGLHYLKLTLAIVLVGTILGTIVGTRFGLALTSLYTEFYKFPVFEYVMPLYVIVAAVSIGFGAAVIGVQASVRAAISLPPAEAMRPEPPAKYQKTWMERSGLGVLLSPASRMVWRNIERRPLKAAMSSLGIAMALAVLILGSFTTDALYYLINFQFRLAQRQDVMVTFVEPVVGGVKREIQKLPGVMQADFFRSVPSRLRHEHRQRRVGIMGLDGSSQLFRLLDDQERQVALPVEGLMLNTKLAELLQAELGDEITIEVLEGQRGTYHIPVTALATELGGLNAYMHVDALHRMLQEGNHVSGAFLKVEAPMTDELYSQLKETPTVAGVSVKTAALKSFHETIVNNLGTIRSFNIFFATIIAVGVVYNSARISLAERSRELATLRVIGFSKAEVSTILLGELAILTLAALPIGMLIGYGLAYQMSLGLDTEVYRIPLVVNPSTYATAALVVIIAAVGSGLLVRRGLGQLDLVGVLKTKE